MRDRMKFKAFHLKSVRCVVEKSLPSRPRRLEGYTEEAFLDFCCLEPETRK